ncbi:hypothetical protein ACP4OV_008843 [Aristida adscensionis]
MAVATTSTCHALLRALHAVLRARAPRPWGRRLLRGPAFPSAAALVAVLAAALVCGGVAALFPGAVAFFLPLVASTSACCAAAHLFAASEAAAAEAAGAAKEVVLVPRGGGGKPEVGLLQVYGDANATAYGGRGVVQAGCFLRRTAKRGVDEDGESIVFAGRVLVAAVAGDGDDGGDQTGVLEGELVALQVDRLAEGVWNTYFGGWSTWNHYVSDD